MEEMFGLRNRSAVVTGGLGQIGMAISLALEEAGASVVIIDCDEEAWNAELAGLSADGRKFSFFNADVSNAELVPEVVQSADDRTDGFDIWVNCAYPRTEDWGNRPENDRPISWRRNVDMQMTATCLYADRAAQHMAAREGGSVVNIASIYGGVSPNFLVYEGTDMISPAAYSAIKGGIISHTKFIAMYYGRSGVRANAVWPGGVAANQPSSFVERYNDQTALGRMAEAEELGPAVVFLASEAASYITGATLMVDGGWTAN